MFISGMLYKIFYTIQVKKQEKAFGLLPSRTINQYIIILEYLQPIEISQLIILDESIKI